MYVTCIRKNTTHLQIYMHMLFGKPTSRLVPMKSWASIRLVVEWPQQFLLLKGGPARGVPPGNYYPHFICPAPQITISGWPPACVILKLYQNAGV